MNRNFPSQVRVELLSRLKSGSCTAVVSNLPAEVLYFYFPFTLNRNLSLNGEIFIVCVCVCVCLTIIPFCICDKDSCGLHVANKTASNKSVFFTAIISIYIGIICTNQAKVSVIDVDNKSGSHAAR